jgi:hypothetical protein
VLDSLEVNVAARYDDYSDFDTDSYGCADNPAYCGNLDYTIVFAGNPMQWAEASQEAPSPFYLAQPLRWTGVCYQLRIRGSRRSVQIDRAMTRKPRTSGAFFLCACKPTHTPDAPRP